MKIWAGLAKNAWLPPMKRLKLSVVAKKIFTKASRSHTTEAVQPDLSDAAIHGAIHKVKPVILTPRPPDHPQPS
jgi:hypothetical protein